MSADPFANTTTVKNILQHVISPKIVSNGSGGYVTKTDIINVDNLLFTAPSTTGGSSGAPLTSQCGSLNVNQMYIYVYHSRVTEDSIIFAVTRSNDGIFVVNVTPAPGVFIITLSTQPTSYLPIGWFIASF